MPAASQRPVIRGIPRSPMAFPGGTPVYGGEDDPHDHDQYEDHHVNHCPSRRIRLVWLIVSHDRSSPLTPRIAPCLGIWRRSSAVAL